MHTSSNNTDLKFPAIAVSYSVRCIWKAQASIRNPSPCLFVVGVDVRRIFGVLCDFVQKPTPNPGYRSTFSDLSKWNCMSPGPRQKSAGSCAFETGVVIG